MLTRIQDITQYLESIAPLTLQESYDNAGLITGQSDWEVKKVLVSLDCTEAVVDDAISRGANMIVAHHPIIFKGLKQINGKNYVERTIIKAIKNNIAIYAIHTNLDNILHNGVNQRIAQRLKLQDLSILSPQKGLQHIGAGIIGTLPQAMPEKDFLVYLKECMNATMVRHTSLLEDDIKTVAICGGSGSFLLPEAKAKNAQVFVSADFKYHDFFDADGQILVCDIGHFESEQFTINLLVELISKKFTNFATYFTKVDTNPINYF